MKKITVEEVHRDRHGNKCYSRVEKIVSDDEYYSRKYYDSMPHEKLNDIFDAYKEFIDSMNWD